MKLTASTASLRDPVESTELMVGAEEAAYCDGSACGVAMPGENGELELLPPHWHIIVRGKSPESGPRCYAIW